MTRPSSMLRDAPVDGRPAHPSGAPAGDAAFDFVPCVAPVNPENRRFHWSTAELVAVGVFAALIRVVGLAIALAGGGNRRLCADEAAGWLERFGLGDVANRHPQSLSGGQKQRLVVACAAVRAGGLLILDEPTSGLDGRQMHALADLLDERRAAGAASLVITHDMELIARVCTHEIRLPLPRGGQAAAAQSALTVKETI